MSDSVKEYTKYEVLRHDGCGWYRAEDYEALASRLAEVEHSRDAIHEALDAAQRMLVGFDKENGLLQEQLTLARQELEAIKAQVALHAKRRQLIASPPPRDTCPGCFVAIYDDAAKQGWCTDCITPELEAVRREKNTEAVVGDADSERPRLGLEPSLREAAQRVVDSCSSTKPDTGYYYVPNIYIRSLEIALSSQGGEQ